MKDAFSTLRQLFRSAPRAVVEPELIRTPVLLASSREDDAAALQETFERSRWTSVVARDWSAALAAQEATNFPVVLCDRDLPGLSWKEGVRALMRTPRHPAIILLSDVADPYLWEALIQAGGFELLSRPLRRRETLGLVAFAHTHWKTDWPDRTPTRVGAIH